MDFYNVKKRQHVEIAEKDCEKIIYKKETSKGIQERYAIRAKDDDGTNVTRFITKQVYDSLKCKVAK